MTDGNWARTPLGDVARVQSGYAFKSKDWREEGVPVVKIANVKDGFLELGGCAHVGQEVAESAEEFLLEEGDLLVTMTGRIGDVARVPAGPSLLLNQRVGRIALDGEAVDPAFIFYALRNPAVKMTMEAHAYGVAQPNISPSLIEQIEILVPPLDQQRAIGGILGSYDLLIANNKRRIEILEEMARVIYRHWFVEFMYPGHEDVLLVESELGPIPEGWEVMPVSDVLAFHIGGGWGKEEEDDDHEVPSYVIRGTDIPGASVMNFGSIPLRYHKTSNYQRRKLGAGDIVMEVSGGGKEQSVGRTLFVTEMLVSELQNQAMCASFCKLLRTNSELRSIVFYLHLDDMYRQGLLDEFQVQSTGIKNFKFKQFLQHHKVAVPERKVQEQFLSIINPIVNLTASLGVQSSRLKETRDLLLPKLVSGEIDISELDIGDAA